MRIGIDARLHFYTQGGIARYATQLVTALEELDQLDEFTVLQSHRDTVSLAQQANFRRLDLWTPAHHRWEQWMLPIELARAGIDLLHSPDFIPPFRRRCRSVITIHDLGFLRFPETLTPESRHYYGSQVARAVDSADAVIAVSDATRQDIVELLGFPEKAVTVVHNGVDPRCRPIEDADALAQFRWEHDLPESFILWLGTLEPRKNLNTLLRAVALLPEKAFGVSFHLVLAGARGWLYEGTLALIDELGLRHRVRLLGPVSANELALLYNCAWLFVFPSVYEGFGFPPLEALACGTPVVCSDIAAHREVLGDAAVCVRPLDTEGFATAIKALASDGDRRAELSRRGQERAAGFGWDVTAKKTLDVYRRALSL